METARNRKGQVIGFWRRSAQRIAAQNWGNDKMGSEGVRLS